MAECYPQGCPPCDGEIVFPENPINGQRECINIGIDPNTGKTNRSAGSMTTASLDGEQKVPLNHPLNLSMV